MIIDGIATNPYLMIGSYVLTAISFILAIAFYLKSKREKIPTFQTYSRTLIQGRDSELSDLKILYKNELQERVTVTKLAFWNAGRETINRVDIADSDILRIEVPAGVRVLDVKLLQQSELSNEFNLGSVENAANSENQSKIPLSFEYVDYRNAVVIQLVHTGDCATKMRLLGKIKGAERIARVSTVKSMGANDPLIKQFLLVLSRPKEFLEIRLS